MGVTGLWKELKPAAVTTVFEKLAAEVFDDAFEAWENDEAGASASASASAKDDDARRSGVLGLKVSEHRRTSGHGSSGRPHVLVVIPNQPLFPHTSPHRSAWTLLLGSFTPNWPRAEVGIRILERGSTKSTAANTS